MRKVLASFSALLCGLFFVSAVFAADCPYVASKGSDKYHNADCGTAKNIKAENKVCFSYPEDARNAGCLPCGICKPAEHSKVVGSKGSDKYHLPTCGMVKNIKKENLQEFNSPEEAVKAGSPSPCGICKPPKPVEEKAQKK